MTNLCDKPLAREGLISYRCMGRFGYVMIGAIDHEDALREALRSTPSPRMEDLEIWNGYKYVKVIRGVY